MPSAWEVYGSNALKTTGHSYIASPLFPGSFISKVLWQTLPVKDKSLSIKLTSMWFQFPHLLVVKSGTQFPHLLGGNDSTHRAVMKNIWNDVCKLKHHTLLCSVNAGSYPPLLPHSISFKSENTYWALINGKTCTSLLQKANKQEHLLSGKLHTIWAPKSGKCHVTGTSVVIKLHRSCWSMADPDSHSRGPPEGRSIWHKL